VKRDAGDHWVTLSNRRRVLLDEEGRIKQGLPAMFGRVHVEDVSELGKRVRQTEADEQQCERSVSSRRAQKFRTTEEGARALLAANPDLVDFLEAECSHDCLRYRDWMNRGRRGKKPAWRPGDGRFDSLQVGLDLKGTRKISSWLEAVYVTVPPSHRWADFENRLPFLIEATGLPLMLPAGAEALAGEGGDVDQCHAEADGRIEALLVLAREERLTGDGADAPF
jgi:hypothetical protein